jgi:hypothetical protein
MCQCQVDLDGNQLGDVYDEEEVSALSFHALHTAQLLVTPQ